MPTSPNSRAGGGKGQGPHGDPTGAASLNGGKKDPQTTSDTSPPLNSGTDSGHSRVQNLSKNQRRNLRQRLRERLAKVREDAQLTNAIDTVPQGAVEATNRLPERVDPATQGEQELPRVIERAITKGWAVKEDDKPELVDELVGMVKRSESEKIKVAAFRALLAGDQAQHERDNPLKKSGGTVNVSVQTNIAAVDTLRQALQSGHIDGARQTTTPQITSSTSNSGLGGTVETISTPPSDK